MSLKCDKCLHHFCSDHFVSEHHGCASLSNFTLNPEFFESTFKCPVVGCQAKGAIGSKCPDCIEKYCLKHRTPDSHRCHTRPLRAEKLEEESAIRAKQLAAKTSLLEKVKASGNSLGSYKFKPKLKFSGENGLSPAIAKIMAKKKAKGENSIPAHNRIYLEIIPPLSCSLEPQYFFFDENLVLGKVIDILTLYLKIPLTCNTDGHFKRLMFHDGSTGKTIPTAFNTFFKLSKDLGWNHRDPSFAIPKIILEYKSTENLGPIDLSQYLKV